jgi:hypothetical protein
VKSPPKHTTPEKCTEFRAPPVYMAPVRTFFNSVQKPQLGAIRFQSCLSDYTELSASTLIPVKNPQLGAPANQVWEPIAPSWPLAPSFSLPRRGYKLAFQEMIRNPHPNREMDRNPYWSLDEISLTVIVKIRQNTEYFHQTTNQCPNCGANCWEAKQPSNRFPRMRLRHYGIPPTNPSP